MIITDKHYISLYINGRLVDLKDDASLSIRLNDVLFNPEQTKTTQASYSFTFTVPSTPNNDSILGYSNAMDKLNKFNVRYIAKVYADETLIFDGSIIVKGYNHQTKEYQCNLVSKKVYSLDDIFGEMKLTDIVWYANFQGASSINEVNANMDSKYYFPLVSYGVFQKDAVSCDDVGCEYTSKFNIDGYNKWWLESFYPSLKTLEVIKKAFEQKGYNVGGTAYNDPVISNIYQSISISEEQQPMMPVGNSKFGRIVLNAYFDNSSGNGMWMQDLSYPYLRVDPTSNQNDTTKYNFSTVDVWNVMGSGCTIDRFSDNYLYDPNEHLFVVPADGWYEIDLTGSFVLNSGSTTFNAMNYYNDGNCESTIHKVNMTGFTREVTEDCPIEFQLVRNYDYNAELIKGRHNVRYLSGDKNEQTFQQTGCGYTSNTVTNKIEWDTEFPHEELYSAYPPTETGAILSTSVAQSSTTLRSGRNVTDAMYGGSGEQAASGTRPRTRPRPTSATTIGYMTKSGSTMPFDQAVSDNFICGFSSWKGGTVAVAKNGYSWSKANTVKNEIFAKVDGLDFVSTGGTSSTTYNENSFIGSPTNVAGVYQNDEAVYGGVHCSVYLHKNDQLELLLLQRDYDGQKYSVLGYFSLVLTAIDDKTMEEMKASNYAYGTTTRFPDELNLTQFMNKDTKVSDWIESVLTAFNLQLTQNGNDISIDTNRGLKKTITNAIDIDNRASEYDAETSMIDYPRTMSVQYKIDTEEWGFEKTVPQAHINDVDWYNYGDSGFTVIRMSNDSYNTKDSTTSTNFSYTYYDNFYSGATKTLRIPVIEKSEYMADGYGYEEAMKHDGYSMTQRFWFRQPTSEDTVQLASYQHEDVYLSYPTNYFNTVNLSYKDSEKSLLTEYFNFVPLLSSNYVSVEVYLTPEEYRQIKCGAKVRYCTDIYWVSEISGFDPSGANKTTLKLIKQV